ncbi:prephenate dehydrogenase [Paenibacillus sp.]|uniref:prephenate dehydrogenase n=1 Tax=Paenibacillus sp. TaxID=58172 RepID=UPI002D3084A8|nr:prephenate dehydrogenase [Paenibacillus sp.]HZG55113.1 prephenate dehydrogenase [Paenibacillus sp.]
MTKIAIFGVGLIGGSLALCFKGLPGVRVVGHSPRLESIRKYVERGVVDEGTTSLEEAAEDADFLFLCVPVGMLGEYLDRLSRCPLKPGAVITDVGSTKGEVVEAAARHSFGEAVFIGGHPMAGKERSGVEAATSKLFENAYYVLTPTKETPSAAYDALVSLLAHTKAKLVRLDPRTHDEIVGAVSHLPHIVAALLVNLVARLNRTDDGYEKLAAGGFRDITRIASSDPTIWRDICVSNREVLLDLLREWMSETERFMNVLRSGEPDELAAEFRAASAFRGALPERRVGTAATHYEFYVQVADEPGTIGKLTTLLGTNRINLRNIGILEPAPGGPGQLRLSFGNDEDCSRAKALLEEEGYIVHY